MNKLNRNIGNLILLVMLLVLASCSDQGSSEQQTLQSAKNYLDKQDLMAASIELRNTLLTNAHNAEARFLLAGINLQIGDLEGAQKEYRRAADAGWAKGEIEIGTSKVLMAQYRFRKLIDTIKIKDSWPPSTRADLLGIYAAAEASLDDIEQAKSTLASGAKLKPDAFHILKTTAIFHLAAGETQQAISTLDNALSVYQNNNEFLLLKAVAQQQEKNFSQAADSYRNVIEQSPTTVITTHNRQARIGLARLAVLEKDYAEAQSAIKPLLDENKNDPDANYLSSLLAFERKDYKLAEGQLQLIIEIAPDHNPSKLLMGKIKYALENYEQAASHFKNYLNSSPDDITALQLLVSSYIALGKLELAKSTLDHAMFTHPNDMYLLDLKSQLQFAKGHSNEGIKELQKSLEAAPDNVVLLQQLAEAYIVAGVTDKAIETLKTFQQLRKDPVEAQNLMILAYLRAGQFQKAINIAQEMLAVSPLDPDLLSLNGSLYVSSGNNDEARKYYEKALQIDKDFVTASIGLARIEGIDGNLDKAIEIYNELVDAKKGGTTPMLALAEIARLQGRTDEMLLWLEKARASAPDEINQRISLANHYYQNKQLAKADLVALEALKISPANAGLLALHGKILIAQGLYNKALSPLKLLVEKEPGSAPARVLLGETYMRLGIIGNARTHVSKALQIQPKNISALALMAEMELHIGAADKSLPYAKTLQQIQPGFYIGYKLEADAWAAMQNNSKASAAYLTAWNKQQTSEVAIKLFKTTKRSLSFDESIAPLLTWLKSHPEDNKTRIYLASAYQENQQNNKAILEYEKIIENKPDDAAILNNLAWLYFLKGDPKALQLAESAYQKTNGTNPYIRDTYGWLLVQQGQHKQGASILKPLMNQSPNNREFQYHYAVAVLKSGKETEGLQILEKLVAKNEAFDGRDNAQQILQDYRKAD